MKEKTYTLLTFLLLSVASFYGKDWADEKDKNASFFAGFNVGGFFANSNTAAIYDGSATNTPYGVNYIINTAANKPVLFEYFNQTYSLEELPTNLTYQTALDLGLHAGVNWGKAASFFLDINFTNLKVQDVFTILVDDPMDLAIEPIYEQFPILGEEKRININLGTQLNFYNQNKKTFYWSIFGNFNSIQLERNYFVINNKEYNIAHTSNQQNRQPSGTGYGAGTGLGFKYQLATQLKTDLTYNFYYIKTNIHEDFGGFGINNGIQLRIIWDIY